MECPSQVIVSGSPRSSDRPISAHRKGAIDKGAIDKGASLFSECRLFSECQEAGPPGSRTARDLKTQRRVERAENCRSGNRRAVPLSVASSRPRQTLPGSAGILPSKPGEPSSMQRETPVRASSVSQKAPGAERMDTVVRSLRDLEQVLPAGVPRSRSLRAFRRPVDESLGLPGAASKEEDRVGEALSRRRLSGFLASRVDRGSLSFDRARHHGEFLRRPTVVHSGLRATGGGDEPGVPWFRERVSIGVWLPAQFPLR